MARRSHFTELCSITCRELEDLGAGERSGWLSDPSLLSALHPRALALSRPSLSLLLLLPLPLSPSSPSPRRPTSLRLPLSPADGRISSIEWLPSPDLLALALATSAGSLLFYSLSGDLIHRQTVHPGRVLGLRFGDAAAEDLCVVFSGALARFDGADIQSLFRRWLEEEGSRMWDDRLGSEEEDDDSSFGRIPFQVWSVSKYGACVDAAIVGLMPPPLLELQLVLLLGSRVNVTTARSLLEKML